MAPSLKTIPALPTLAPLRPPRHTRSSTNPPRTSVGTRPDGTRRFFARSRTPPHFAPSRIASRTAGARRGFSMMIGFRDAIFAPTPSSDVLRLVELPARTLRSWCVTAIRLIARN